MENVEIQINGRHDPAIIRRMAVVVEAKDVDKFLALANTENLEATVIATVTEEPRLVMHWNGKTIVNLSREFLNSNGAEKHIDIAPEKVEEFAKLNRYEMHEYRVDEFHRPHLRRAHPVPKPQSADHGSPNQIDAPHNTHALLDNAAPHP